MSAVTSGEYLKVECIRVAVPACVEKGLATDRCFHRVKFRAEVGLLETLGASLRASDNAFRIEVFSDSSGVISRICIDVDCSVIGLIDSYDHFPLHLSASVEILWKGRFTNRYVARIDDNIGI